MRLVSAQNGRLITVEASVWTDADRPRPAATGLAAIDALLPPAGLARGAVHELLYRPEHPAPAFFAVLVARWAARPPRPQASPEAPNPNPAASRTPGALVWIDPDGTLYPPAVFAAGIDPARFWILRPRDADDLLCSAAECMRCRGVSATVAPLARSLLGRRRLDRRDARRLQLAAERGGGAGILLRSLGTRDDDVYAAATRWLVEPAPGTRSTQRWKITLVHGHGGQVGNRFLLEHCRDPFDTTNDPVRATDELVGGTRAAQAAAS